MDERLTSKDYWRKFWENVFLPVCECPSADTVRLFKSFLPGNDDITFLEVGCAPGGWMAYFHKQFGYTVSGIEYEEYSADITRQNLQIQDVKGTVITGDFFTADLPDTSYDIVFSGGFIEHFEDLKGTVERICALSRRAVVTIIPNVFGINGFISRTIRPEVYNNHMKISRDLLRQLHEDAGMKTLYCNFHEGLQFIMPASINRFSANHPQLSKMLNSPFIVFNKFSQLLNSSIGFSPKSKMLSASILYIGEKYGE